MTDYKETSVHLGDSQIAKLKKSYKDKEPTKLRLNSKQSPNFQLLLTPTQINQLSKGKDITISKTQINKQPSQLGGFLPFLIPAALKALAVGALSGAASLGTQKLLKGKGCTCSKKIIKKGKGVIQNWERK